MLEAKPLYLPPSPPGPCPYFPRTPPVRAPTFILHTNPSVGTQTGAGPPHLIPKAASLTVTGATESTLQAAAAPILAPPGTPATVGAPQAQGALGCLSTAQGAALGSAEQPPAASGHTPQGQVGGAQTLRGAEMAEEGHQAHMSWGLPGPHPLLRDLTQLATTRWAKTAITGATASSLLSPCNWKCRP